MTLAASGTAARGQYVEGDGLLTSADAIDLAPGESIVGGDPLVMQGLMPPQGGGPLHHGAPPMYTPGVNNICDAVCEPGYYGRVEALYMRRSGNAYFTRAQDFDTGRFDHEWAPRITIGRLFDCINGYEFVYAGRLEWDNTEGVHSAGGGLDARFIPGGMIDYADIDTFYDAVDQSQRWRARMNNFEFNRTWRSWDVVTLLIGLRVIEYEEDYGYRSELAGGEVGVISQSLDNRMVGGHIGLDLLHPVSQRLSIGTRSRAGLLANFGRAQTTVINDDDLVFFNRRHDTKVAGILEFGVLANYRIAPRVALTVGYEFWWLGGVGTVPRNMPILLTERTGRRFRTDDVVFHGATAGVEVRF